MEQTTQKIQVPMMQRSVTTELSEEFSIPDYQPEIKRILRVEAQAMPADRYVGASSAEFSGKMAYTIFYLGEDGELYGSSFEGDYRVLQPLEIPGDLSFDEGILCDADIFSEAVTGRLLSPRKFLVKTRLHSEIRLYATKRLDEDMGDCESECLPACLSICERLTGESEPFHVFDEIPIPPDETIRVIASSGRVLVSETLCTAGKLSCRGDVVLKLTIAKEGSDGAPTVLLRRVPFTTEIALDGLDGDCKAAVRGIVTDCTVTVEEGRILCDAEVVLSARALQEKTLTYTRDAYAIGRESTVATENCACPLSIACGNGNFTFSTAIPLADAGLSPNQTVFDVTLTPVVREVSTENRRLILSGSCRCHVVANGTGEWTATEFEVPFRYDGGACDPLAVVDSVASAAVLSASARPDGNALQIESEIAVSYTLAGENRFSRVVSLTQGEAVTIPASSLRACYPAPGESLWNLAKRYHQPLATLAEANRLPADNPTAPVEVRFLRV